MKKLKQVSAILLLVISLAYSNTGFANSNELSGIHPNTIDPLDSVFLSLTQATVSNNIVEIPVYILSDDNIYTLDFSFKLDTNFLTYLSLTDHTGHIQHTEYFNNQDRKFRFTSNSFNKYPKGNNKVVSIKLKMKTNAVKKEYFQVLMTYLNGDLSSSKIKGNDIIISSSNELHNNIKSNTMVFPNPASDHLIVNFEVERFEIFNQSGLKIDVCESYITQQNNTIVDIRTLHSGYYSLIAYDKYNRHITFKFIKF